MKNDFELFKGKNLSDIFEDIYQNQRNKKQRISELIFEIKNKIRNINDWAVIGPLIKDLVDTSVRNDEALIKLATVAQRLATASVKNEEDGLVLTDSEKKQLLDAMEEVAHSHGDKSMDAIDDIANQIHKLEKKVKKNE